MKLFACPKTIDKTKSRFLAASGGREVLGARRFLIGCQLKEKNFFEFQNV